MGHFGDISSTSGSVLTSAFQEDGYPTYRSSATVLVHAVGESVLSTGQRVLFLCFLGPLGDLMSPNSMVCRRMFRNEGEVYEGSD